MILELIMNGSSASFAETLILILLTLITAFFSIILREYVKDRITVKLGGYAAPSLNPFARPIVSDLFSAAILTVFSGSWVKAKNPVLSRGKTVVAALSAPITNLLVAFISIFLYDVLRLIDVAIYTNSESHPLILIWISIIFSTCVLVNIAYAIFDILPIPGTNGGIILSCFLPEKTAEKFLSFDKFSYIILLFIIIVAARSGVTAAAVDAVADFMETPFVALSNLLFPVQINY